MIFLILIIAVAIASIRTFILSFKKDNISIMCISFAISLFCLVSLVLIPKYQYESKMFVKEMEITSHTLQTSRAAADEIENAALTVKIIEINQTLARYKYLNSTFFGDIFVCDDICKLDYLNKPVILSNQNQVD